jgi:hypothetical protein
MSGNIQSPFIGTAAHGERGSGRRIDDHPIDLTRGGRLRRNE